MIISEEAKEFKIAPQGSHLGRLYSIIDLGHQEVKWNDEVKIMHKVVFTWELHGEDNDGNPLTTEMGKPLIVSKRYTVSLGDQATLRKDLEGWSAKKMTAEDRKKFDLKGLLGKLAMVNITHSEDGRYANISSLSPIPAALRKAPLPDPVNPEVHFWLAEFDQAKFDALPQYYREKIAESSEWRGQKAKQAEEAANPMPDDIPF